MFSVRTTVIGIEITILLLLIQATMLHHQEAMQSSSSRSSWQGKEVWMMNIHCHHPTTTHQLLHLVGFITLLSDKQHNKLAHKLTTGLLLVLLCMPPRNLPVADQQIHDNEAVDGANKAQ